MISISFNPERNILVALILIMNLINCILRKKYFLNSYTEGLNISKQKVRATLFQRINKNAST